MEIFNQRYSCRNYLSKPVEKSKIQQIMDYAHKAPSSCNKQPWRYFVVTQKDILDELKQKCFGGMLNNFMENVPVLIGIGYKKDMIVHTLIRTLKGIPLHFIDIGISTDHLMLEATSLGLATCWIGWFNIRTAQKILKVTNDMKLCGFITLGYSADEQIPNKKRKDIKEVVNWIE